jgi:mono/diheme cytochrome c family protein
MSFFVTKTLLAALFIAAGFTAALSMLTLMGKSERRMSAVALRNTHRVSGYAFAALLVVLAILGLHHLSAAGDTLSLRGVLHWSVAALLVFVLALKLAVVRWFKQFLKLVPAMGMIVVVLALVVATLSAVFFVVTGGAGPRQPLMATPEAEHEPTSVSEVWSGVARDEVSNEAVTQEADDAADEPARPLVSGLAANAEEAAVEAAVETAAAVAEQAIGDAGAGEQVFTRSCAGCHHSDSVDNKIGPGLAGLFARDEIASSGQPVTTENIREQIVAPAGGMPAFKAFLSEEQLDDLIAFLQTL